MKFIPIFILCIVLMSAFVSAHALDRKVIVRSDGEYNVQFSSDPEFPLAGRETHLDFIIWDNDGQVLTNLNIVIEVRKGSKAITVNALEAKPGHYSIDYIPEEPGVYRLMPIINNERVRIDFELYFDTFWPKGILPAGTIGLFLIALLTLMYKDCKKKKSHEERVVKKKRGLKK